MSRLDSPNACPICGKPSDPAHGRFCSRGCKDRDLLQWLGEGYRIPAGPAEDDHETGLDRPDSGD